MSKPKIPVVVRKQVALWSEGLRLCERGARRHVDRHGKRSNLPAPNRKGSGRLPFTNTKRYTNTWSS